MKHTFVICAYKESKYLEDCIKSLKAQEVKSDIKIATSTPNEYIYSIADKEFVISGNNSPFSSKHIRMIFILRTIQKIY